MSDKSTVVAWIAVVGGIATAIIGNWNNLFPTNLPESLSSEGTAEAVIKVRKQPQSLIATAKSVARVIANENGNVKLVLIFNGEECGKSFSYRNPGEPTLLTSKVSCSVLIEKGEESEFKANAFNNKANAKDVTLNISFSKS